MNKLIKKICDEHGYGNIMDIVYKLWRKKMSGSNFTIGPCESTTVPCECVSKNKCDWCCGCGWLTRHVKKVKDGN